MPITLVKKNILRQLLDEVDRLEGDTFIAQDFNCIFDQKLDTLGKSCSYNLFSKHFEWLKETDVYDLFRYFYPLQRDLTFSGTEILFL